MKKNINFSEFLNAGSFFEIRLIFICFTIEYFSAISFKPSYKYVQKAGPLTARLFRVFAVRTFFMDFGLFPHFWFYWILDWEERATRSPTKAAKLKFAFGTNELVAICWYFGRVISTFFGFLGGRLNYLRVVEIENQ